MVAGSTETTENL